MATDPLVPTETPFNFNVGINYETDVAGRAGRSITADLNQITQYFGLIKTYHDVTDPNSSSPTINPGEEQVISYVTHTPDAQVVMGTYQSALVQGGYGAPWSGPGFMTSQAYTDAWVQMIITSFGSVQAVKDHLGMILLGNEIDQLYNHPDNIPESTYMMWFGQAFTNLKTSLQNAGLGSIPISTSIAAYDRPDSGQQYAHDATQYIYQNWNPSWNGGRPIVMFNAYTGDNGGGFSSSTDYSTVINYYNSLETALGSNLEPFSGETGYSSFYTQANQNLVYNQISTWLNDQYANNGHKTIPLFAFDAFDQPSQSGVEQQFGIFGQDPNNNYQPTGLKPGLTLPSWTRDHFTDSTVIQTDYSGIVRQLLPDSQTITISDAINVGTQSEIQYISSLLSQVGNTTIPAVGVEGSMYSAVGTSNEVTLLATQFLPAQVAYAIQHGLNPQVYASEGLGLAFSFQNETGSTAFATAFGPNNPVMPNSTAGDAVFAMAAANSIFGAADDKLDQRDRGIRFQLESLFY